MIEQTMLYPVYVHPGDDSHAHGVTIPDFPGCFSAADSWDELPRMVQEAVELYCGGEDLTVPAPSSLDLLMQDERYRDGVWLMVDIDLSRLNPKAVRLNISLPEKLLKRIDDEALSRHMSRSAFLAMAAQSALENERQTNQ